MKKIRKRTIPAALLLLLCSPFAWSSEASTNQYSTYQHRGISVSVPVDFTVLDIDQISGRMVITAMKKIDTTEVLPRILSEVWFFRNFPSKGSRRSFEDRLTVLSYNETTGEGFLQARSTVSILDATAVNVQSIGGSNTLIFDLGGIPLPVEWPKLPENGAVRPADSVVPLAWVKNRTVPGSSYKLVCEIGYVGGPGGFFATYELNTGLVELITPEKVTVEFLLELVKNMDR